MTPGAEEQVTGCRQPMLNAHRLSLSRRDLSIGCRHAICGQPSQLAGIGDGSDVVHERQPLTAVVPPGLAVAADNDCGLRPGKHREPDGIPVLRPPSGVIREASSATRNGANALSAPAAPNTISSVASSHATSAILSIRGMLACVMFRVRQRSTMILSAERMMRATPSSVAPSRCDEPTPFGCRRARS